MREVISKLSPPLIFIGNLERCATPTQIMDRDLPFESLVGPSLSGPNAFINPRVKVHRSRNATNVRPFTIQESTNVMWHPRSRNSLPSSSTRHLISPTQTGRPRHPLGPLEAYSPLIRVASNLLGTKRPSPFLPNCFFSKKQLSNGGTHSDKLGAH